MLGPLDLQSFMESSEILAELITLSVQTPTVADAAKAVGTSPDRIIKSLLFLVDGEPILAIASGISRIDRRLIAAHFGVGRKRVKLADAAKVLDVTGYAIGTVPPFGQRQSLTTLIDPKVFEHDEVYAGGGAIDTLVRVSPVEIQRVTGSIEVNLQAVTSS
jgi:prolyl-tRNA editing enzyme YbaK/EbsC (Cys-tRNA(Pro) deacylase)